MGMAVFSQLGLAVIESGEIVSDAILRWGFGGMAGMRPFVDSQAFILQEHESAFSFVLVKPQNAAVEGKHVYISLCGDLALTVDFHVVVS